MNEANLQRLIDHVDGLTEHLTDWSDHSCFRGMAKIITGDKRQSFAEFLGIEADTGDIYGELVFRINAPGPMHSGIGQLSLDEQKHVLKHALRSAKTGTVDWLA